jgi:nucleotide-binding universal stress UspA family protein
MRQILIASDLSLRSDLALRRAVRLAGESGAALTVVHVVDGDLPERIGEHQEEEAKALLNDRLRELSAHGEVVVLHGAPAVEIIRKADAIDADLIVLGAHRPAFFADLILGANIARIARHSHRPMLLVLNSPEAPYASVVVGIDFSPHARRALVSARRIAPQAEIAALHGFHIDFKAYQTRGDAEAAKKIAKPIADAAAKEMDAFLGDFDRARLETCIVEDTPNHALRREIAKRKADLVAIGAHGRSGLARAILGSLAEEMLMDPPTDVLVTRDGAVRE